ncbi:NADH dehydrogenase [ubiquinone] iron-sulfur protein 5 [Diprion similis]|uniref:NADH dehydrogenase [ubiquinone] iron-sulfur protein 5 n=1 Tax=Diprion similis TaxID=362088 RepID=UPI001EF85312|nr:NADH dehydrogenase [ubiquinone] iron-sulfur protein 5 [Diprion similis]
MDFTPIFRTPVTDLTGCILNAQQSKRCRGYEMHFYECMEAYGIPKGYKKCSDMFEDYHECLNLGKQKQRVTAMKAEQARQYREGTLPKPYAADPPKIDSY